MADNESNLGFFLMVTQAQCCESQSCLCGIHHTTIVRFVLCDQIHFATFIKDKKLRGTKWRAFYKTAGTDSPASI